MGLSLIIWIICGVISIFGAQTYAELGCMIPKAGGDYEYIMAAFGSLYGFLFVWSQLIIIIPTANAVAALTFADYILQPIYNTCQAPLLVRTLIAASAVRTSSVFLHSYTSLFFNILSFFNNSYFDRVKLC